METKKFLSEDLKNKNNWVYWKLESVDGKNTKRPYNIKTGGLAMPNNPKTWASFKEAMNNYDKTKYNGFGFVLDEESNITFIDLDHCIENGVISDFANQIIQMFPETYIELSQSQTGIHILCKGKINKSLKKSNIEIYSSRRFIALTGNCIVAKNLSEYQSNLDLLYDKYADKPKNTQDYTMNVCDMSNSQIIDTIKKSKNGSKFWEYFAGTVESNSENTLALATMLAFWCGNDFGKIKEIMYMSGLRRDKFDRPTNGKTWIDLVIEKAIQSTTEVYNPSTNNSYVEKKEFQSKVVEAIENQSNDYSNYFITSSKIKRIDENDVTYIKSGFYHFDHKISGFALGEVSVWSGLNSSGKSAFLMQQIIEYALQGYKTVMFSGEMQDYQIQNTFFRILAGKKNLTQSEDGVYWYLADEKKKVYISNWLDDKMYLYKNTCSMNAEEILAAIRYIVKLKNIKMVILDNLMIMNLRNIDKDKYEAQSAFVKELAAMAKELMIHIQIVMHPRKAAGFLRKDDISGTADLTNAVDNVFIVHRNNRDFKIRSQEIIDPQKAFMDSDRGTGIYAFDNIIEICKNRRNGVQDEFIGFFFEIETKKFLLAKDEERSYLSYI